MEPAIEFLAASKTYRLYPSRLAMFLDVSGFRRLLPRSAAYSEYEALKPIDLRVMRGERLGIIGRNGAGKTTLLRLIVENFQPTRGIVKVHGRVQALMSTGLGFHPDLTGAENIRSSLIYNGLSDDDMKRAYTDIVDFVELGEYLDQPFKTYSLGMQSRVAFAAATAVKPEILIIDEVMGAGDAYFAAKSAERMEQLTSGGATLLLVSHSMAQIVQFCKSAVWLDSGSVAMRGEALEVVKAYEKFIRGLDEARLQKKNQEPARSGNAQEPQQAEGAAAETAQRAISQWPGTGELKLTGFRILGFDHSERGVFDSGEPMILRTSIRNLESEPVPCTVAISIYSLDGKLVLQDWSPEYRITAPGAEIDLRYDPLMLGNSEYVVSVALFRSLDMADTSTAIKYDLWDRSFQFKVVTPYPRDQSLLKPPVHWHIEGRKEFADAPRHRAVDSG